MLGSRFSKGARACVETRLCCWALAFKRHAIDQHLDTEIKRHESHLLVQSGRSSQFACPRCGKACPAHDFHERRWRHLNFFQHHYCINARVPTVKCLEHGVHLVELIWVRKAIMPKMLLMGGTNLGHLTTRRSS